MTDTETVPEIYATDKEVKDFIDYIWTGQMHGQFFVPTARKQSHWEKLKPFSFGTTLFPYIVITHIYIGDSLRKLRENINISLPTSYFTGIDDMSMQNVIQVVDTKRGLRLPEHIESDNEIIKPERPKVLNMYQTPSKDTYYVVPTAKYCDTWFFRRLSKCKVLGDGKMELYITDFGNVSLNT